MYTRIVRAELAHVGQSDPQVRFGDLTHPDALSVLWCATGLCRSRVDDRCVHRQSVSL